MREASSTKVDRCRSHYEAIYNGSTNQQPLECVLHAFLNGAPSTSAITSQERAIGLASASFWLQQKSLPNSSLIKFSIGKLLIFDDAIPLSFIKVIIKFDTELLRWGIRYSQLFENRDSVICEHLRKNYRSKDWIEFFAVCDRLLIQLQPYKEAIKALEKKLRFLSITDYFSYLSLLAWQQYFDHFFNDTKFDFGRVYDRLLQMKLLSINPANLQVSEASIAQSIKSHLMPLLLPESHPQSASRQCAKNLEAISELFAQTKELIDYEGSIDWFSYSDNCRYQYLPNKSILFDENDSESRRWIITGQKSNLLWHYWFNRGVQQFMSSEFASVEFGSEDNQDANVTVVAKVHIPVKMNTDSGGNVNT